VISITASRSQEQDTSLAWRGVAEMIVEVDGGYQVLSKSGKNLGGPYKTLEAARRRLHQVEYFKHVNGVR
jgi:hypothetical protein